MYHWEGRSGYNTENRLKLCPVVRQVSSGYIMYSIGAIVIAISIEHWKVVLGRS